MIQDNACCKCSIYRYPRRVKLSLAGLNPKRAVMADRKPRGSIERLSRQSMKRLDLALECMLPHCHAAIDLTYPDKYPSNGRLVKRHLNHFRIWLQRYGVEHYFWCLEFQERDAPHFHFIVDCYVHYEDVARAWYQIVGSGDPNHLAAGTKVAKVRSKGGVASYMAKYVKKQGQKDVPDGYTDVGRFWGHNADLVKPLESITYVSGNPKHILGSVRVLRKLKNKKRGLQGYAPLRGQSTQRGFSMRSRDPKKLLDQFMDYSSGNYPVIEEGAYNAVCEDRKKSKSKVRGKSRNR